METVLRSNYPTKINHSSTFVAEQMIIVSFFGPIFDFKVIFTCFNFILKLFRSIEIVAATMPRVKSGHRLCVVHYFRRGNLETVKKRKNFRNTQMTLYREKRPKIRSLRVRIRPCNGDFRDNWENDD